MDTGVGRIQVIRTGRIRLDITVMSQFENVSVSQAVTKLSVCYITRSFIIALTSAFHRTPS